MREGSCRLALGDRPERGPTTKTKWMDGRHQVLRHWDCALAIAGNRRLLGLFIAEAVDEAGDVSEGWKGSARDTLSP